MFLVTATLVAASFGDLIASSKEQAIRKLWAGFFCLVVFILCIVWFGVVAGAVEAHAAYDAHLTALASIQVFAFAVCICAGTVLISENAESGAEEDEGNAETEEGGE